MEIPKNATKPSQNEGIVNTSYLFERTKPTMNTILVNRKMRVNKPAMPFNTQYLKCSAKITIVAYSF